MAFEAQNAAQEMEKAQLIAAAVTVEKEVCQVELDRAIPAVKLAMKAGGKGGRGAMGYCPYAVHWYAVHWYAVRMSTGTRPGLGMHCMRIAFPQGHAPSPTHARNRLASYTLGVQGPIMW